MNNLLTIFTGFSEGRKFGVGVCPVSQRPSKLDADSLSQCMTRITMRIINPTDQQQIAQSIESASRELISELPSLAERSGDNLRGGDQYADLSEDTEEAHERCEGEE